MPYSIETADGEVYYGVTDQDGRTARVPTISAQNIKVIWGKLPPASA
jgi:uncharacterized protein (DUF2345 family)